MEAQDAELDTLNAQLAPFRLLKGVEANIKADGTIDVPDEALASREWVIASLHTSFDKNPTERVLGAMEHPHVHCIGHLTGRKIGRRAGAGIDIERAVEKALETRTCLEIDSQPDRLDIADTVARLAGEAGVPIAVTSDAHRLSALTYVELGIGQARRAWLTKQHVVNTRTWPQIEKLRK
jgi:DNA polymerase (family 10)